MASTATLFFILLSSVFISTTSIAALAPSLQPSPHSLFATILSNLGFQDLSSATADANLSIATPTTIFATTDSSLLTCPSCSIPLLLQEHSLPGLYPLHFLRTLAFGTKIETFAPNRCLTITSTHSATSFATKKVFINGVEITKPDLFNNGLLIIHGLQGFISHLSPLSCRVERMTSLSYPRNLPPIAAFVMMRLMLKDAMMRLRISGYSVLALAMRVKYPELSDLKSMTLFALDDSSIFAGGSGHSYVADLGFHVVPNRLLMAADLVSLPKGTELPTMEKGQNLVITTAGGSGRLAPMRINYMKIKNFDMVHNKKIVVHVLSMPFPRLNPTGFARTEKSRLGVSENGEVFDMIPPLSAGISSTVDDINNHGGV
ncbi:fasciclin-like arabinogalactan protein 21 [Olea europaea var. sylvestris]|uniref:fasciclin-like arabinogalactan protein 21 n=1 Tax=Olea europaea var. sylvestris TaxID=158386 RepID=UPI000C1CDFCD|nr:fasciclin-like arabinogalactan protein 21 [Olea europaea var. sylvestris]